MISLIAAMAKNRVIGHSGRMPWHLPAELAHFKKITLGKTVLMGRRTFESIGRPLPHRRNLIITRQKNWHLTGCEVYPSLEAALTAAPADEELMVIGGATLYLQTLPLAQRLYLSFIECESPGDTYFPAWDPAEWQESNRRAHPADTHNLFAFTSVQLDKLSRGNGRY